MKFYLVVAFLLCFVTYQVQSEGGATTPAQSTPTVEKEDPTTKPETVTKETEAAPKTTENGGKTEEKGTTKAAGMDEDAKSVIDKAYETSNASTKCKNNIMYCYGSTSTDTATKGKDLTKGDKEAVCTLLEPGKKCITTKHSDNQCTAEEYENLHEAICFSPRTVASILFIAVLCFMSKLLSQQ